MQDTTTVRSIIPTFSDSQCTWHQSGDLGAKKSILVIPSPPAPSFLHSSISPNPSSAVMDYQRCADLHNEILYRGWIGSGQDWVQPQTWWEEQSPSDETASHLSPSLIEFLKRAYRQPKLGRPIHFFYYLQDLSSTDRMINDGFLDIAEENRYVLLYPSSI
jgi:hypothetical protein